MTIRPLLALFLMSPVLLADRITVDWLYDTDSGRVLKQHQIEWQGERFTQVHALSGDTKAAHANERWVALPGLIDAHTHLIGDIQAADVLAPLRSLAVNDVLLGARHAHLTLAAGFTTVRDVGTFRAFVDVALRDAILRGDIPGPRMWVAGAYLTAPGGGGEVVGTNAGVLIPDEFRRGVATNENEVRQRVRELIAGGADFIKMIVTGAVLTNGTEPGAMEFSENEIRAAVEEARLLGKDITAHAHGAEGIKAAIRAGVRSIEHASLIDEEGLRLAKKHGTYLVMDIYNGDYIRDIGTRDKWDAEIMKKNDDTTDAQRQAFRRAVQLGVKVVYGTDSGVYPHGDNLKQMAYMMQYGMNSMQAVQAASLVAAEMLRQQQDIGSVRVGKRADMVLLPAKADGSPDFSASPRVLHNGVWVTR